MIAGIIGYGAYVPRYRIKAEEIAAVWGEEPDRIISGLNIKEKSVPATDEDTVTLAVEAARNALKHSGIDPKEIGALYVGSESHPYAVKPTASIVAEAIGATPNLTAADLEFACKAGTAAIQMCMGLVASGMVKYGMAIGADTSQGRPGDALEYSASAGAAAYIIGKKKEEAIAEIIDTYSFTTDTPDFWRREGADFPQHGGRFTGEPAYFKHVISASKGMMEKTKMKPEEFDYAVFHQPNGKFPLQAGKMLGFSSKQLERGLLTPIIGNTYSAASPLGLANVLDEAKPNKKILLTSFGSGAGSDSFVIRTTDLIDKKRKGITPLMDYVNDKQYLSYGLYVKHRRKLKSM
ncbi:Hydroxymethylglutaryl-CoA synthase [Candidatus Gugararchaeum adminiculabundum]|nr:Hydroxymethylglutaryl-CoA synthase [Candidatus Gugararchaeum adminiculabundum]